MGSGGRFESTTDGSILRSTAERFRGDATLSSKGFLFDLEPIDLNRVVSDLEVIRRYNPQRFEMEQLTAIVYEDGENHHCIGYKETSQGEFWAAAICLVCP